MMKDKNKNSTKMIFCFLLVASVLQFVFAITMLYTKQDIAKIFRVLFVVLGIVVILLSVTFIILNEKQYKKVKKQIINENNQGVKSQN